MSKEIFKRFKRNAAMILGSRLVFGLLNVLTSILMVRFFGLVELGIVVLLNSYTRLFNDIIKFDSWQAVVTYGAKLQEKQDNGGLKRLIGLLLSVDFFAMALGVVFAVTFAPYAAGIFEWPDRVSDFAPFYVLSIFFMAHATPNGILRLFDRVDAIAAEFALKSSVRFIGVLLTAAMGGNVFHLVVAWFAASIIAGSWPLLICALELKRRKLLPVFTVRWPSAGREFKNIWRFLAFSNASSTTVFFYTTGTTLFLGSTLGAASAAIVEIAHQFTGSLSQPVRILGPIISPEFAKLAAKGEWKTFRKILSKQLKITGGILLALSLFMFPLLSPIVNFIYGPEALEHIWLFRFLLVFVFLKILAFTFDPAILAANKPGTLLLVRIMVSISYCSIALALLFDYGTGAIGFAAMVSQMVYILIFLVFGRKLLRKRVRKELQT